MRSERKNIFGSKNTCAAVIPAAGNSSRMKGMNKLIYELDGVAVTAHTLMKFENCAAIDEIVIATRPDMFDEIADMCKEYSISKVSSIVAGGATRTESVIAGVRAVGKNIKYIAVHDAARPFVSEDIILKTLEAAIKTGAAAPAVPVKDTIKRAVGSIVVDTPKREELFAVQTPQIFDRELLLGALGNAVENNIPITDDCSAVEAIGMSVFLTEGDYSNIKITTPEDFVLAKAILDGQKKGEKQ